MKSNYKIFTAVFLSAIMTAAAGRKFFRRENLSVMEQGVFLPY